MRTRMGWDDAMQCIVLRRDFGESGYSIDWVWPEDAERFIDGLRETGHKKRRLRQIVRAIRARLVPVEKGRATD